jgi:hypothetical protein
MPGRPPPLGNSFVWMAHTLMPSAQVRLLEQRFLDVRHQIKTHGVSEALLRGTALEGIACMRKRGHSAFRPLIFWGVLWGEGRIVVPIAPLSLPSNSHRRMGGLWPRSAGGAGDRPRRAAR